MRGWEGEKARMGGGNGRDGGEDGRGIKAGTGQGWRRERLSTIPVLFAVFFLYYTCIISVLSSLLSQHLSPYNMQHKNSVATKIFYVVNAAR